MIADNSEIQRPTQANQPSELPVKCRCGGKAAKPKVISGCKNRWIIQCEVQQCYAFNIGQGLADTVQGWNRLSTHFYR